MTLQQLNILQTDLPLNLNSLNDTVRPVYDAMTEYLIDDNVAGLKKYLSKYSPEEVKALVNVRGSFTGSKTGTNISISLFDAKSVAMCEYLVSVGVQLNAEDVNNDLLFDYSRSFLKIDYLMSSGMALSIPPTQMLSKCIRYACTSRESESDTEEELLMCEKLTEVFMEKASRQDIEKNSGKLLFFFASSYLNTRGPNQKEAEVDFVLRTMKKLFDKGAQINESFAMGSGVHTVLTMAMERNNKEVFNFIVNYNPSLEQTQEFIRQIKASNVLVKDYYSSYLEKTLLAQQVALPSLVGGNKTNSPHKI